MNLPKILVTGANGQVGSELKALEAFYPQLRFSFTTRDDLALEKEDEVENFFRHDPPQYLINTAAYTAVDKAESDQEKAFLINTEAVATLALICKKYKAKFIHISTDYVFDGNSTSPYTENSVPNPATVYGSSKFRGEQKAFELNPQTLIIRTSWVYSTFGKNFVKTMLGLMKQKDQLNVVNDQFGSPTYAADLAEAIMYIVSNCRNQIENNPGIYHFSNKGIISWYEFALAIKQITNSTCHINPITTKEYPTAAKRPAYSALDPSRIRKIFGIDLKDWQESLTRCLSKIKNAP